MKRIATIKICVSHELTKCGRIGLTKKAEWWQVGFHVEELLLHLPDQIYQPKVWRHEEKLYNIPWECFGGVGEGWPEGVEGGGRGQVQVATCLALTTRLRHILVAQSRKLQKIWEKFKIDRKIRISYFYWEVAITTTWNHLIKSYINHLTLFKRDVDLLGIDHINYDNIFIQLLGHVVYHKTLSRGSSSML